MVYVRSCHGATVRWLEDLVKQVLQENHIGTNDLLSGNGNKDTEVIINLVMSVKKQSCGVLISSITVRKDKHQNKVQLRNLCQAKNVIFIDNSKSIKSQNLNKSRLHLARRGTNILSTTFVRKIPNIFHWRYLLHSPNKNTFTACCKSTEYQPKIFGETSETNHQKFICLSNLNKLIFSHLRINSTRK